MAYPALSLPQFGVPSNYDAIKIETIVLPLTLGTLRGGTKLDTEKRKTTGRDYPGYKSQGLDSEPVSFQLNLFVDLSSGKNWLREYEKIRDRLMPRSLDARNAISVYHPSLAEDGITQIIVTHRPILAVAGVEKWTVDITGMDARFVKANNGKATKTVDADKFLKQKGAVQSVTGPLASLKKNSAKKTFP